MKLSRSLGNEGHSDKDLRWKQYRRHRRRRRGHWGGNAVSRTRKMALGCYWEWEQAQPELLQVPGDWHNFLPPCLNELQGQASTKLFILKLIKRHYQTRQTPQGRIQRWSVVLKRQCRSFLRVCSGGRTAQWAPQREGSGWRRKRPSPVKPALIQPWLGVSQSQRTKCFLSNNALKPKAFTDVFTQCHCSQQILT